MASFLSLIFVCSSLTRLSKETHLSHQTGTPHWLSKDNSILNFSIFNRLDSPISLLGLRNPDGIFQRNSCWKTKDRYKISDKKIWFYGIQIPLFNSPMCLHKPLCLVPLKEFAAHSYSSSFQPHVRWFAKWR